MIDTSVLIDLERQGRELGSWLNSMEPAFLSTIALSEMLVGAFLARSEQLRLKRTQFVDTILRHLPLLTFGEAEAREHARLFVELRRAGTPVGERDLMIAATALANGHSVLTKNVVEFSQVPGLKVEPV